MKCLLLCCCPFTSLQDETRCGSFFLKCQSDKLLASCDKRIVWRVWRDLVHDSTFCQFMGRINTSFETFLNHTVSACLIYFPSLLLSHWIYYHLINSHLSVVLSPIPTCLLVSSTSKYSHVKSYWQMHFMCFYFQYIAFQNTSHTTQLCIENRCTCYSRQSNHEHALQWGEGNYRYRQ